MRAAAGELADVALCETDGLGDGVLRVTRMLGVSYSVQLGRSGRTDGVCTRPPGKGWRVQQC